MVSKEEFQGWVLDYACYHRIFPIIQAISLHHSGRLEDLPVPQLRLACATINMIIESEQLSEFDVAIELVETINQAVPPSVVCKKTYLRLLTGLKIKALFQTLQDDLSEALVKLNTYFPRTTKSKKSKEGRTLLKFNQNHKNFRCFIFSLISNANQLRAYLQEDYNAEFGQKFMESIKKLCRRFLQQIESQLLPPIIERVLVCAECEKFPQISAATEMLLDFVQEKKLSSQLKMSNQEENPVQQSGHRTSTVFTEQELFEMLTIFCPIYTQDQLACDHSFNLSSPDLFDDSLYSQQSLHPQNSRNRSPSAIISNSQELHSRSIALSAETQERPAPEQRTPKSQLQIGHLHQQQPETVDSFLVLQEKTPVTEVKVSEECSPIVPSQSTPENPLRTAKLRGEDQLSLMETEVSVPQCENFDNEMEPAQSPLDSNNRPPILEDAIRLSQTHLKEPSLLQVASQNEVPPRQETAKKNFLAHSEISKRTLGRSDPNQKMSSDDWLQNKLREQESSPQIPDIKPFKMTHVSSPLPEKDDRQPSITSTPISYQPTKQQEDDRLRETCHLPLFTSPDPLSSQESFLNQPTYIKPWLMYSPKQPSYKLLHSKVFRSCNVYDRQYPVTKIEITKHVCDPSTTGTQLLEKNSPKHSLILSKEDLAPLSCQQTDKDSDAFPNSWATTNSLSLSTDLSSISSGSCDIVTPSDSNSAELFFMSTPEETIDRDYNFINKHLIQGINACVIKLYRNQQLDVVEKDQVYTIYI